jgi:hypothetical protein
MAIFPGLTDAELLYSLSDIGGIKLKFIKPDLSTGYIDRYVVSYKRSTDNGALWIPLSDDENLSLDPYDVLNANYLIVRGLQLGGVEPYCFKVEGKIGNLVAQLNYEVECVELSGNSNTNSDFRGPSAGEFPGLRNVKPEPGKLTLYWTKPTAGYYSQYIIKVINATLPDNLFDLASTNITSTPLDPVFHEAVLSNEVSQMQMTIPVSPLLSYRIAMTTNFPNPFTASGDLPISPNKCVWTCTTNGTIHSCIAPTDCPRLDID